MGDSSEFETANLAESAIRKLQAQTQSLAQEIHQLYGNYLAALARAVRQHAIQSAYHLCTHCYPAEFLRLDAGQQQGLQKSLRRTISNSVIDLLRQLDPVADIVQPDELMDWMQAIDDAIEHTLPSLSKKINYLLQQARVVPQQVPRQLMEAALRLEEANDSSSKHPNILSVLVEKDAPGQTDVTVVVPIQVIFLRLVEVEFGDLEVSKLRQQIQASRSKIASLRRTYQHKQRQMQSAAATKAWHQSWFGSDNE
jgi:cell division protein FtsB